MKDLALSEELLLDAEPGPSITTMDGFTIQVDCCGGFNLIAPGGRAFAWAQTMEEADAKVERERKERTWTREVTMD